MANNVDWDLLQKMLTAQDKIDRAEMVKIFGSGSADLMFMEFVASDNILTFINGLQVADKQKILNYVRNYTDD